MGPIMLRPDRLERIENVFESSIHVFQFFKQTVQMDMTAFRVYFRKEAFHIGTLKAHIYAGTVGKPGPLLAAIFSHITSAPLPTTDAYGSEPGDAGNEICTVIYDTSHTKPEIGRWVWNQSLKYA